MYKKTALIRKTTKILKYDELVVTAEELSTRLR
jgi:hypothetical protein